MRYFLIAIGLILPSTCLANTYNNCTINNIFTHDQLPNLVVVTLNCTAPDAMGSGGNCTAGAINPSAFVFDSTTANGKAYLALTLTAMAAGENVSANTYGSCPTNLPDTLQLYSLRVLK
jgi:hypothetical protein